MRLYLLLASCVLSLVAVSAAQAGTGILISASGSWDADAPQSDLSAPGAVWSLSFSEPSPLNLNSMDEVGLGWETTFAQDFIYTVGGASVTPQFSQVVFYTSGYGGAFDVNFTASGSTETLSLYSGSSTQYVDENGNVVVPVGPVPPAFGEDVGVAFTACSTSCSADNAQSGSGNITISALNDFTPTPPVGVSAIPEPSDWVLMMVGFGTVGGLIRRRRESSREPREPIVGRIMPSTITSAEH